MSVQYRLCWVTVRMKVLRNGKLVTFPKRTDCCCSFSCSVCKQNGHFFLGLSRASFSKVMTAYTNHGKTSASKRNSGRKPKVSERNRRTLKIVSKNQNSCSIGDIRSQYSSWRPYFHKKTVRREPHKSNIHFRPAIAIHPIIENNAKQRKRWCIDHTTWTSDVCIYVIWSDESYTLTVTLGRVYARRTLKKAYNPDCMVPSVKHGGGSVMIWAAISCGILLVWMPNYWR